MTTRVTLIPGDGIGPSICRATVRLLEAAGAEISWEEHVAGMAAVAKYGDPIPDETLDSIKRTRIALNDIGPWTPDGSSANGSDHLALIERAVESASDPRAGELAVRLSYAIASAKGKKSR